MQARTSNLHSDTTIAPGTEQFMTLLESGGARIERIVSNSHSSPEGFWYDQSDDEWVLLVAGDATLEFDPGTPVKMSAGDHVFIPCHTRHRVRDTSPCAVWLAIHLKPVPQSGTAFDSGIH